MGWPLLEVEGVEADDVIGTLALQARQQGVRTVISSSDKDLTQLVDPQVTMVNTMSNETFDEAGVVAKFGVKPDADHRLPHADRRQRRQHSRCRQGRARRPPCKMAGAIRHARQL